MFHYVQKPPLLGFEKRVVTCNMEIWVCSIIFQEKTQLLRFKESDSNISFPNQGMLFYKGSSRESEIRIHVNCLERDPDHVSYTRKFPKNLEEGRENLAGEFQV